MCVLSSSDLAWDRNPRRQQELRMRPWADAIYQNLWPGVTTCRHTDEDATILDKLHGIDMELRYPNGMQMTMQEKFLSFNAARFQSVTVEYEQNQFTHEPGDWYHLACELYFCGYANELQNGFSLWVLLNWPALVLATIHEQLHWNQNANKDGRARASFMWCRMADIPDACIIAASWINSKNV